MNDSYLTPGLVKRRLEFLRKKMGAINVVCGIGPVPSNIMFIGEAPGQEEDEQDMPFVGRSGDLLNVLLKEADINRSQAYVTNTVKCRPTLGKKNRPPTDYEINSCKLELWNEIKFVRPKIIVTLGLVPTRLLLHLEKKERLQKYVGKCLIMWEYTPRIAIMPLWHPSFLLRSKQEFTNRAIQYLKEVKIYADTKDNP